METERESTKPTAVPPSAAISAVLGDDDLLREILLRLAFPTTLVRAALVSRRWLRHASDPAFLRRFRDLHPPRLVGCYLSIRTLHRDWRVEFVPVPPQPTVVDAVRRTSSSSGTDDTLSTHIVDCRNGWVVTRLYHGGQSAQGAISLLRPGRAHF